MRDETQAALRRVAALLLCCAALGLPACNRSTEPPTTVESDQAVVDSSPSRADEPAQANDNERQPAQGPASNPDPATLATCQEVQAAYGGLVANRSCASDADCQVLGGSCAEGLGGCAEAVNTSVTQAQLGALTARWTALGCIAGACRCAEPGAPRCQSGLCEEVR